MIHYVFKLIYRVEGKKRKRIKYAHNTVPAGTDLKAVYLSALFYGMSATLENEFLIGLEYIGGTEI